MSALAVIPTAAAIDAAWERYRVLMAAFIETPSLALDRGYMERLTRAEREWKTAFLGSEGRP